jgi:hypothetical protein
MPSNQDYLAALQDLNDLVGATFYLSVSLNKFTGDSRKQLASVMFAKINLCALSITKLLPADSEILPQQQTGVIARENFCDVPSVASLCRNLIEASNLIYYFAVDEVPEEEVRLRLQIGDFQAVHGSLAVLRLADCHGPEVEELEGELANVKAALKASAEFCKLDAGLRKQILNRRKGATLSQRAIAERRGFHAKRFGSDFRYLSGHVHTDAYSLMDLLAGNKVGGPMTDEIRASLIGLIRETTRYLAHTLLDMVNLFPDFKSRMTSAGLEKMRSFTENQGVKWPGSSENS